MTEKAKQILSLTFKLDYLSCRFKASASCKDLQDLQVLMAPKVFQVHWATKGPREMQVCKDPRVSKVLRGTREGMVLMV